MLSPKFISPKLDKKTLSKKLLVFVTMHSLLIISQCLFELLKDVDQEENTSEFDACAASLVQRGIVRHSDKTIRLYAACCLTEIIRIYAPDAPYTDEQLKVLILSCPHRSLLCVCVCGCVCGWVDVECLGV